MTTPLTTALTALMEKVKLPGIKRITDSDMPAVHIDHEGIYGGTVVSTLRFDIAEQFIIGSIVQACVERGWDLRIRSDNSLTLMHDMGSENIMGTSALSFVTAFQQAIAAAVGRESDGD